MNVDSLKQAVSVEGKVLVNPKIHIEGNIITSKNNLIQISNISRAWAGAVPKNKLSVITIVIMVLMVFGGYGMMQVEEMIPALIGLAMWVIVGGVLYSYAGQTQYHAINLELNSGNIYSFTSDSEEHIEMIFQVISKIIIENNGLADMLINFGNGTIINKSENVTHKLWR